MTSFDSSHVVARPDDGPFTGDPDTQVIHLTATRHYQGDRGQIFWELRPAVAQGYVLCPECCGYAKTVSVGRQGLLERTR